METRPTAPVPRQEKQRGLRGPELFLALFVVSNPTLIPTCLTYKNDVERTCDAEHLSGVAAKNNGPQIVTWLKKNIATPEGVVLVNELSTKSARDESIQLRGEARKYGIAACPLADTFELQAKEDSVREDVANLCAGRALQESGVALLDISAAGDDAERIREIRDWSLVNLKTAEAQAVVTQLAQRAPKDRSLALRSLAGKSGIPHCALSDALDQPLPVVAKPTLPVVPKVVITKYDGDRKYQNAATDTIVTIGDAISNCYANGLVTNSKLTGKVGVRVTLDAGGKLKEARDDGSTLADKNVVKCIIDGIANLAFPKPAAKGAAAPKFTVTFTLTATSSSPSSSLAVQPSGH